MTVFALKIITTAATSLIMRVKGGGPDAAPEWFRKLDGSYVSSVLFSGLCFFFYPWWQALLAAPAWFGGNAPSIGEEVGAIGGIKGNWFSDRDSWFGAGLFKWVKNDRLWGWLSGALRGAFLGALLAAATFNPWLILAGASFPLCYFVGVSIKQVQTGKKQVSWHWGEWIFGAAIGVAL